MVLVTFVSVSLLLPMNIRGITYPIVRLCVNATFEFVFHRNKTMTLFEGRVLWPRGLSFVSRGNVAMLLLFFCRDSSCSDCRTSLPFFPPSSFFNIPNSVRQSCYEQFQYHLEWSECHSWCCVHDIFKFFAIVLRCYIQTHLSILDRYYQCRQRCHFRHYLGQRLCVLFTE